MIEAPEAKIRENFGKSNRPTPPSHPTQGPSFENTNKPQTQKSPQPLLPFTHQPPPPAPQPARASPEARFVRPSDILFPIIKGRNRAAPSEPYGRWLLLLGLPRLSSFFPVEVLFMYIQRLAYWLCHKINGNMYLCVCVCVCVCGKVGTCMCAIQKVTQSERGRGPLAVAIFKRLYMWFVPNFADVGSGFFVFPLCEGEDREENEREGGTVIRLGAKIKSNDSPVSRADCQLGFEWWGSQGTKGWEGKPRRLIKFRDIIIIYTAAVCAVLLGQLIMLRSYFILHSERRAFNGTGRSRLLLMSG